MDSFATVVVSDLHLGARNARVGEFLRFLDWVRTDELILAGDVFDDPRLRRLDASSLRVINALMSFARRRRVVLVRGNHDPDDSLLAGWGVEMVDEMVVPAGRKKYLVCHGHLWDKSMGLPHWLINGADTVYHFAQRIDPTHRLARGLKRGCKHFCRSIAALQRRAVLAARERGLDGVILGHTHMARNTRQDGVHYLNSGCWTETPSAFVGIRRGQVRRYYWESVVRRAARAGAVPDTRVLPLYPALTFQTQEAA
jgi:UDP-2,3-diacylglucosamine pyrophosphatase LpxH